MKKPYIAPYCEVVKPLFEKPLLSESNESLTGGIIKTSKEDPTEEGNILFNARTYNVWNTWDE